MSGLPEEARERLRAILAVEGEVLVLGMPSELGLWPGAREVGPEEPLPEGSAAGALIGVSEAEGAPQLVLHIASAVREGGPIALVARTQRTSRRGVRAALLGVLRRRPTLLLEDLCEALLLAHVTEVRALELEDAAGWSLAWGRALGR